MKKLIAVLALTVSSVTFADSVKIFELQAREYNASDVSTSYKLNYDLGRAWVEVTLADTSDSESTFWDTHRVKVVGLSMNADKTAIVYEANGLSTECARVTPKRGIFGGSLLVIKPTGECEFETKIVNRDVDNGFEIRPKKFVQVYLSIK